MLNENEADRFGSTEIKIPTYFFQNFSATGLLPVESTGKGSFIVEKAVEKASPLWRQTILLRFHVYSYS